MKHPLAMAIVHNPSQMANEQIVTLYDSASLSSKGLGWNPYVQKIRYILNFKKIAHKTTWLEYPDMEPTLRSIGASPTGSKPDGSPHYTVPAIIDHFHRTSAGESTVVYDSWEIAEYLDATYPSPAPLFPEGTKALQKLFHDHLWNTVFWPTAPIVIPLLHDFLNEKSRPYWRETREGFFKAKLENICPRGKTKWEETWENVQKGFAGIAALLDNNGDGGGPFVMGSQITYVDFTIASLLETIAIVVPDEWERKVMHWDGGRWARLRTACAEWKSVH